MPKLQTIWEWVVYSSANSERYSLTLKGALGTLATFVLFSVGLFHLEISEDSINGMVPLIVTAFDASMTAISYIATALSAWAFVWGAMRKLISTLVGENAVLVKE